MAWLLTSCNPESEIIFIQGWFCHVNDHLGASGAVKLSFPTCFPHKSPAYAEQGTMVVPLWKLFSWISVFLNSPCIVENGAIRIFFFKN